MINYASDRTARRFVTSWKNMSKRAHIRFLFFYATYFHSSDGKAKKKGKKWRGKRWNIAVIFSRFSESFLTIRTLAIRVIAPTTNGKRESVLHDNLYEGLIVSINEPLAESSQTSTINSASAFCTAIEKRDIKVKWTYLKLGKSL